jgi:hypothetical protein
LRHRSPRAAAVGQQIVAELLGDHGGVHLELADRGGQLGVGQRGEVGRGGLGARRGVGRRRRGRRRTEPELGERL